MERWLERQNEVLRTRQLDRRPSVSSPSVDLASNDYLGLASHPVVVEAACAATRRWGTSARASRLVTGTTPAHLTLESALADWCGFESALVFSSGYTANLGVVTALSGPGTLLVVDEHAHASLVDAARLSRSPVVTVPHHDLTGYEAALSQRTQPRALVVVESVYSVLGDLAPLSALLDLARRYDATLLVDEAHGLGIRGAGRGFVHELGLAGDPRIIVTGTLSKALASQGGFVLGSHVLREFVLNRARSFMFDTGLTPAACAAAEAALDLIASTPELVGRVPLVMAECASACGVPVPEGPLLSVPTSSPAAALNAAARCAERGVAVGVFRPPSTPDVIARVRLTADASLTDAQLVQACVVLADVVAPERVDPLAVPPGPVRPTATGQSPARPTSADHPGAVPVCAAAAGIP